MDWMNFLINAGVTIAIAVGAFVIIKKYINDFFEKNLTKIDAWMEEKMGDTNAATVQLETAQILKDLAEKFEKMAAVDSFQEPTKE